MKHGLHLQMGIESAGEKDESQSLPYETVENAPSVLQLTTNVVVVV
jgi:hypothetical protein